MPTDLDNNNHLNNGRYLTLMDLGRWDLVVRTGLLRALLQHKWHPVVGAATIRFRRSLDPFQRFELKTRILGWDERDFYIEQRFERDGEVHAVGLIRGVFLGKEGRVPLAAILAAAGSEAASPPLPEWVETWRAALDAQSRRG